MVGFFISMATPMKAQGIILLSIVLAGSLAGCEAGPPSESTQAWRSLWRDNMQVPASALPNIAVPSGRLLHRSDELGSRIMPRDVPVVAPDAQVKIAEDHAPAR